MCHSITQFSFQTFVYSVTYNNKSYYIELMDLIVYVCIICTQDLWFIPRTINRLLVLCTSAHLLKLTPSALGQTLQILL